MTVEIGSPPNDTPIEEVPQESVETTEQTPVEPQQSQYEFNPDNYGVIFRGERVVPKDQTHLQELLQMGHSYATNKEKFNSLETENQRLQQQWQQYDQLNRELIQHPELANQFQAAYQKYMQGQTQPGQVQQDPATVQRLEQLEQKMADDQLSADMQKVMASHGEHDWNKDTGEGSLRIQLLKFMQKNSITDPEFAYRAMMFPQATEQAKMNAARQTTQAIQNQHRAGIVSKGTAAPPAPTGWNPQGKSYDQAEEAGLAMLQQMKNS